MVCMLFRSDCGSIMTCDRECMVCFLVSSLKLFFNLLFGVAFFSVP